MADFHGTIKIKKNNIFLSFVLNRIGPCGNKYPSGATNQLFCRSSCYEDIPHAKNIYLVSTEQTGTRDSEEKKGAEHITFLKKF